MKKKNRKAYLLRVPTIIKETLGEDVYNQIQKIMEEDTSKERKWIVYGTPKFWDAVHKAIDEEIKRLTKK